VVALERELSPRWVLARSRSYRRLLDAGVALGRAHDVELTEGLLVGADGGFGEPHGLAAAVARLDGRRPRSDPPPVDDGPPGLFDPGLSDPGLFDGGPLTPGSTGAGPDSTASSGAGVLRDGSRSDELADVVAVHAAQQRRLAAGPAGMRMLVAAESTGALVAEEMRRDGLPWRADVHDRLLTDVLGPRPVLGGRPPRLAELAREITDAFGGRAVNPDSPADLLRAFARAGYELRTTRAWEIRKVDHPAVAPLLAYKELARLHAAHGWSWLDTWVRGNRFHPEYVVGGVVSGRWATRGGGALQIPRAVRAAVRADPGWRLVVADAAQLEPRVLAAMAREPALAPDVDDLYSALAAAEFGGDRAKAKLGLLGAMYGQTSGGAAPALATLRRRFPSAMALLEDAARAGEEGRLVRSHLGRTCPPARPGDEADVPARARGRFTRNFVVQATAAEWALVLLAELRHALRRKQSPAQLVFFQHDEVLLHVPAEVADDVAETVHTAAATAGRRLFGDTPVRFPMQARVVSGYDEKDAVPAAR
ncbi:MAG: bifunctional 3'-5' exonuclease/DNA polymerase, partial [Pseudonocardia sediminis]